MKIEFQAIILGTMFIIIALFANYALAKGLMNFGAFLLGISTVLLAFATFMLALTEIKEGRLNREQIREEANKDRRRLRLKEQIEGLYAPLMAEIEYFNELNNHIYADTIINILMHKIRSKYEYLASDSLKRKLREYYKQWINFKHLTEEEWKNFIVPITDTIGLDYVDLAKEYTDLTKPVR